MSSEEVALPESLRKGLDDFLNGGGDLAQLETDLRGLNLKEVVAVDAYIKGKSPVQTERRRRIEEILLSAGINMNALNATVAAAKGSKK